MDVTEQVEKARDAITVKRVFGEPYERDGVTVIPAANVMGGAGGGSGEGTQDGRPARGSGTGFGLAARPAGAYVIRNGEVTWQPAVDVNRIVIGCQVIALVAILAARSIRKARIKRT